MQLKKLKKLKPAEPKKNNINTTIFIHEDSSLYPYIFEYMGGPTREKEIQLFLISNASDDIIDLAIRKKIITEEDILWANQRYNFIVLVERDSAYFTNLKSFDRTFAPLLINFDNCSPVGYASFIMKEDGLYAKVLFTNHFSYNNLCKNRVILYPALSAQVIDKNRILKINALSLGAYCHTDPNIPPIYFSKDGMSNYDPSQPTTNEA